MAVTVDEVLAVWRESERRLRVIPRDDPGRDAIEASIADLGLLYKWLTSDATARSAARLTASRDSIEAARKLLRTLDERHGRTPPERRASIDGAG
jgi:hypothetical protein